MIRSIISYEGKSVYVGIDVHKENYAVACVCEGQIVKKATVNPERSEGS